jgi:sugar lactone lactonase YvrE
MITAFFGTAFAALPAPNWMPSSPILAGNQVVLLWAPVPGAVRYVIYMNGKKIQESVSIQAIIGAPEKAGTYEFEIAALDASSAEGARSRPGVIKIIKLTSPTNLQGRLIGKKVGLNWGPVEGAVLYNVYRSTKKGTGFDLVDSIQDVRWTDSKAQEGKKYYYRVSAKDAGGKESSPSEGIMVSTVVPEARVTGSSNKVVGLKTRLSFKLTDKDFTLKGIVKIAEPYDIESSPDRSRYYVSSVHTHSILVLDSEGELVNLFGEKGEEPGKFRTPKGIGVGPDGRIYVADSSKNEVMVFRPDGSFDRVFAKVVRQDWMNREPSIHDVAVDKSGNVHILEYYHGAVITYNRNGKELSHFALKGDRPENTGFLPYIKVVGGKFYLADAAKSRVVVTDARGKVLHTVGRQGSGIGLLAAMGGFDVAGGKIYMCDRQTYLIQVYDLATKKYEYTLANEDNTAPMPLTGPKTVEVDPERNRILINQGMVNQIIGYEMFGTPEEAKGK